MIKFQQSPALTSHFESLWSIEYSEIGNKGGLELKRGILTTDVIDLLNGQSDITNLR